MIISTLLMTFAFQGYASISCSILMDGFDADGKKTVFDLDKGEKEKYNKCVDGKKLLSNDFKAFEDRTKEEARKRKVAYKESVKDKEKQKELEEIKKSREEYTFSAKELEEMFNKPIFAYRLAARVGLADKMEGLHHKLDKLTDMEELCKHIGEENDIKGMHAKEARLETQNGHAEISRLSNQGVVIPDSFFTSYELFETSDKDIKKMKRDGSRAIKILEFSEITCVSNSNKKDDFEDLTPKLTLVSSKTGKEIDIDASEDEVVIDDTLDEGQSRTRDIFGEGDADLSDIERMDTSSEVDLILRQSTGNYGSSRPVKKVIIR